MKKLLYNYRALQYYKIRGLVNLRIFPVDS